MRAVVYREYGSPDVLDVREVDEPHVEVDDALVRVRAASLNSWDWDLLRGKPFMIRLEGPRTPRYEILGADIAGVVEAVGQNVTEFEPGDEVFGDVSGCGWGGLAELVCARPDALAPKPRGLTFEQAAAVPQAGVLALQGLHKGGIGPGRQVLVNGAGGGVGTFAVQMAKTFGAEVTGVDRPQKLDLLRSIGADHVIDCTAEDFTESGLGYDLVLDVVAHHSLAASRGVLNPGGSYVVVGGSSGILARIGLLGPLLSMVGGRKVGLLLHRPRAADLVALTELLEAGDVVPVVDRVYPLTETADAFRRLGNGLAEGKLVISM